MADRKPFFDTIRARIFGGQLLAETVRGCEAILDEWDRRGLTDARWLGYMLATARGECGRDMLPVREGFKTSDAEARAYVTAKGYAYAKPFGAHVYYGRGLVQLTWHDNYQKMGDLLHVDLVNNPDKALEPPTAAAIMFEGMIRGTFTGKKLADYFGDHGTDWDGARHIINGSDRAAQFGAWGKDFYAAVGAMHDAAPVAPTPAPSSSASKPEPSPAPLPPPGAPARPDLAPTFWGRFKQVFGGGS